MVLAHYLLRLYTFLLRLYPLRFRQEFSGEMRDVFTLALTEAEQEGALALVGFWLAELRDLPLSVVHEHWRERQQKQWVLEGVMTATELPIRTYRWCTWGLLATVIIYGLLVLLPFFSDSLSSPPASVNLSQTREYPSLLNTLLYVTALGVLLIGPIWLVILGGRLVFVLARHWARLLTWQRRLGLLVIVISLGTLALMVSPLGQRMLVWFD